MRVTIATDSWKGSLTSMEAGAAIKEGILRADPEAEVTVCPLADGGEGTTEALILGMGGERFSVHVTGPLGGPVVCAYGIIPEKQNAVECASGEGCPRRGHEDSQEIKTAVLEMSGAAGLPLVPDKERNPLKTTTYGVGEVIRDAIARGCRHFVVGIGGSATNDGGIGMLQALGFGMLDENGGQVPFGAEGLSKLVSITRDQVMPELSECTFRIACDVNNPLCGRLGASAVYGPQKGATPEMVQNMDRWLAEFAGLAASLGYPADPDFSGAGAAGGMGFAFRTFLHGELEPGVKIVLEETKLEEHVKDADVVVTGEGRLDAQTVMGKAPVGVAQCAKKFGKPVIAFSGCAARDAGACNGAGIDAFFPVLRTIQTLEEAMKPENSKANLSDASEQAFRLFLLAQRSCGFDASAV